MSNLAHKAISQHPKTTFLIPKNNNSISAKKKNAFGVLFQKQSKRIPMLVVWYCGTVKRAYYAGRRP